MGMAAQGAWQPSGLGAYVHRRGCLMRVPALMAQCLCAWAWCPRRLLLTELTSRPPKTMATATHCCGSRGLPFQSTESRMLKNLRVVVTRVLVREPKARMAAKMKTWPRAPQPQKSRMSRPACGGGGGGVVGVEGGA